MLSPPLVNPTAAASSEGFCAPTLVSDVPYTHRLWKHEMFLPIAMIGGVDSLEQAMRLANDVEYGLTASIWTRDLATAHRLAARVEAGYVWINSSSAHYLAAPFGGYKQSGVGREESIEEMMDATQIKNVHVEFDA